MHRVNPICVQAKKDREAIVEAWEDGKEQTLEMGLWYLINSHLCKDIEMAHYWKHYHETYEGAVYPNDEEKHHNHNVDIYTMTEDEAKSWVSSMINADGTKGEHWNINSTTNVMKQKGIKESDISPLCFYVALNKVYSDGYETAKQFGIEGELDYYVARVKEMMDDEDSVSIHERLSVIYHCIRKK